MRERIMKTEFDVRHDQSEIYAVDAHGVIWKPSPMKDSEVEAYKIVSANSTEDLAVLVNRCIVAGFTPLGGPLAYYENPGYGRRHAFAQAMVFSKRQVSSVK